MRLQSATEKAQKAGSPQNPLFRAIDSFLSGLTSNEDKKSRFYKDVLTQYSVALATQSAEDDGLRQCAESLADTVRELEQQQRLKSKTLFVADKLEPLLAGLWQYIQAFDVVIQAAPAAATVLYGGARLLLQLARNFHDCFSTVLDIMARIGTLLHVYELFTSAYQASDQMQNLLVESYKHIVYFWQKATNLFEKKTYKTFLRSIVKPLSAEWQQCYKGLRRDCDEVRTLTQAEEAGLRRQKDLNSEKAFQTEIRRRIVNWLMAEVDAGKMDARSELRKRAELQHPGTCRWVFEDSTFKMWKEAPENSIIWYHGPPGTGKTVMCSALSTSLKEQGFKTAYFFFQFNDPVQRQALTAIRSLALQLLTYCDEVPQAIVDIYEDEIANHAYSLRDLHTAVKVLKEFLKRMTRAYVILDGLDECDSEDRHTLKDSFGVLMTHKTRGLIKWLYSSRPDRDMRLLSEYAGANEVPAPLDHVTADIKTYLYDKGVSTDCCPVGCVDHWAQASDGNFQWMKTMLLILQGEEATCEEEILEDLNKFPKNLNECYLRSLQQLSARPLKHQELARKVFSLLVVAEQPLRLSALGQALSVRKDAEDHSSSRVPKSTLIEDICGHLIVFDRMTRGDANDPFVKLAHKSIHDFFLQDPDSFGVPEELRRYFVNERDANLEAGELCLTYLMYTRYTMSLDVVKLLEDKAAEHAFLGYAAGCWFKHLSRAGQAEQLVSQIERFIQSEAFWTCLAVQSKAWSQLFRTYFPNAEDKLDDDDVYFGVPLPLWLEDCKPAGPEIVQNFTSFLTDWHVVLTSFPRVVHDCDPDIAGKMKKISISSRKSRATNVLSLQNPSGSRSPWRLLPGEALLHGGLLGVKLYNGSTDGTEHNVDVRRIPICLNQNGPLRSIEMETILGFTFSFAAKSRDGNSKAIPHVSFADSPAGSPLWFLSLENLSFVKVTKERSTTFEPPKDITSLTGHESTTTTWDVQKVSLDSRGSSAAYHCRRLEGPAGLTGTDEASSQSSDSGSESSSDDGDDTDDTVHHNLCVASAYDPIWFHWQTNSAIKPQISCAFHPAGSLAVWSHAEHELCIVDLRTKIITPKILPEPVEVSFEAATVVHKELQFSPCGKILHYFLCLINEGPIMAESVCSVVLTSWYFPSESWISDSLARACETQSITYRFSHNERSQTAPFVMSHGTFEKLYVALPTLSCAPKIISFSLQQNPSDMRARQQSIQTLRLPVFFPSSTPSRKPQLLMCRASTQQPSAADDGPENIVLILDGHLDAPPVAMVFDITEYGGWKDWNIEEDERAEELKIDQAAWKKFRANFIDSKKRFAVPVRSGLDWRRKAYVSCGCW